MIVTFALLASCTDFELPAPTFELPRAAAVLQPEVGGPFEEPVGFVANGLGGQVVLLALKQGRFLTDDPTGSFLPANQLPTGDRRLLSSIAVYAPETDEVTVIVADRAFEQLVVVDYLTPCPDGETDRFCEAPPPRIANEEELGDEVVVDVKRGWTTTEDWTFTPTVGPDDEREWTVEGSRSGLQPSRIRSSELPWSAEDRRLQVEAIPAPTEGAEPFVVRTELPGLRELDVGGVPLALELAADQSWLALIVRDDSGVSRLAFVEPATLLGFDSGATVPLVEVPLPDGAEPHRLSVSEEGGLLVADATRPAYYEVPFGTDAVVEHPLPWPSLDVAGLRLTSGDPTTDVRFVVPIDGASLWRHDPTTSQLLDVNPARPGEQGIPFSETVQGIEAMPWPFRAPELDDDEERVVTRAVAVSLADGRVVFAHEATGCLVQDIDGPETNLATRAGSLSTDITPDGMPDPSEFLGRFRVRVDEQPNRVTVNRCAGIAQPESWAARFDQTLGTWEVEGTRSGIQENRVIEDERYVSDDGAISFLLRSGVLPSADGWQFTFSVDAGIATASGDGDNDGVREADLSVSGDPVFFFYRVGEVGPVTLEDVGAIPDGFSYNPNIRPFVLVPGGATNRVSRVNPSQDVVPLVEVSWN